MEELAVRVEVLDAHVGRIRDIERTVRGERNAPNAVARVVRRTDEVELTLAIARLSPGFEVFAVRREELEPVVGRVDDPQRAVRGNCHAGREEQWVGPAGGLPHDVDR